MLAPPAIPRNRDVACWYFLHRRMSLQKRPNLLGRASHVDKHLADKGTAPFQTEIANKDATERLPPDIIGHLRAVPVPVGDYLWRWERLIHGKNYLSEICVAFHVLVSFSYSFQGKSPVDNRLNATVN